MKKLKLLVSQFRLNIVLNTFFILQCIFVFLFVNSTISGLMYDGYVGKYAGFEGNTTLFLSGAVEKNVSPGEPTSFFKLVNDIRNVKGVNGVGYQMNEYFVAGKNEDVIIDAFILSDDMVNIKYPLSQGRWFKNENLSPQQTQVVLGGDIAKLYKVNETITLYKLEVIDDSMQYVPIEAEVIGKMREPAFAVNLHFSSNQPEYINLFEPYQNLILTNDQTLISSGDIRYPLMSLLIFTDSNTDITEVKEGLVEFGQPFDFNEVDKIYRDGIAYKLANKLPTTGIMILGVLFGVIGITYLGIYQNMKTLSVYYLYGMSRKESAFLNALLIATMLIISFLFSIALYFVPSIQDYLFRRAMLGLYNFIFSFAFIAMSIGISLLISYRFSKRSPISTLRRFE